MIVVSLYTSFKSGYVCVSISLSLFLVAGCHWLIAAFWLVSQQTDICLGQWAWRGFNLVLGGVHVFLFLNVKDGPSRYRMAGFYTVTITQHEGQVCVCVCVWLGFCKTQ